MGLLDSLKKALGGKSKEIESGVDKVADIADEKTGGKHTDTIDSAADTAKDTINKLAE